MKRSLLRNLWLFGFVVGALGSLCSAPALAAEKSPQAAEAAERFNRALRHVNAGDLFGGLAEFQRAYALVPSPVVLYNLGLVYAALERPVEAVRALEAALSHSDALTAEERERGLGVLEEQRAELGWISLTASTQEGVIEVDNRQVAKLPLHEPLAVSAGTHVIGVVTPGHAPARREVMVAARESVPVHLDLVAIEGRLAHIAVTGRVPAADVSIDGQRIGQTPLESTISVAPGSHRVEVRRAGYITASRTLMLTDGSTASVTLEPTVDRAALPREGGYLSIHASETQVVVSVDGGDPELLKGALWLPRGPHRLRAERGGFLPAERDVVVRTGSTTSVAVVFEPTPETRANYVDRAESRRTWSLVTLLTGAAILGGGVAFAVIENHKLPTARRDLAALEASAEWGSGRACDPSIEHGDIDVIPECSSHLTDAAAKVDDLERNRTVGWVAAGIGGAVLVTGTLLLITGDNPHRYDEKPATRALTALRVGVAPASRGIFVSGTGSF